MRNISNSKRIPIKVGLVIGQLTLGGAEKQFYLLAKNMDKTKYHPIVFCLSEKVKPWGERLVECGIEVVVISRISRFDLTRILRLSWQFYKKNIDIIISYLHEGSFYAWCAKKFYLKNSKFIVQIRSRESHRSLVFNYINKIIFDQCDAIVSNSYEIKKFLIEHFYQDSEKISVIANGLDLTSIPSNLNKTVSKNIHLGIIGKDTYEKNINMFIRVALRLISHNKKCRFHIVGKGLGDNSKIKNIIPKENLSYFKFYGEVDHIMPIYNNFDIYVSTSNSEGLPNVIMEAMANGIPVVATNVGGTSDLVIHNKTGFLVKPNDINTMVYYCNMLAGDEQLRNSFGKNGKELIRQKYTVNLMVKKTQKLIEKIVTF